jgi:hypothetical protein
MTEILTEKIASLFLSTIMRLDSYEDSEFNDTIVRFETIFEEIIKTEEHLAILKAICNNARIDFHVKTYDSLVKIALDLLFEQKKIALVDYIKHLPIRFLPKPETFLK